MSKNNHIHAAFDALTQFLETNASNRSRIKNLYGYEFQYPGKFDSLMYFVEIDQDWEHLVFYIAIPIEVPEDKRQTVAEYITRANFGLRIGNFEMNYDKGHIRYNSTLGFKDERLTVGLIENTVAPAIKTVERYLPGFALIIRGDKTPLQAIEKVEGKLSA